MGAELRPGGYAVGEQAVVAIAGFGGVGRCDADTKPPAEKGSAGGRCVRGCEGAPGRLGAGLSEVAEDLEEVVGVYGVVAGEVAWACGGEGVGGGFEGAEVDSEGA